MVKGQGGAALKRMAAQYISFGLIYFL